MTKKSGKEESKLPVGSEKVIFPDPTDLVLGLLWIQKKDGSFVNAATDPKLFDEAITEHVELFDRVKWPEVHRIKALIEAGGDIPLYRIHPEKLPPELQEAYNKIKKPEEVSEEELGNPEEDSYL
jgi:hypothetical protein